MNWARRLKRVFGVEIEQCVRCGGRLKVIASIEEPDLIERILAHRRNGGKRRRRRPRSGRERRRRLPCLDSADCLVLVLLRCDIGRCCAREREAHVRRVQRHECRRAAGYDADSPARFAGAFDTMAVTRHRRRRGKVVQKSYPPV